MTYDSNGSLRWSRLSSGCCGGVGVVVGVVVVIVVGESGVG